MKKKILAFIFSLCLIIPCMFIFSACGDEPPADDPTKWKTVTEATCTTEGLKKRTIDGNEETEKIPALGHNYGAWTTTLNETCTTNGSKQQTCERCNDIKTETILAHHTLDGTILFDETEHWEHCTKCTEKVNAEEHSIITNINDNYLLFDAAKYIGYSQTDTCEHCNLEIQKSQRITQSEGDSDFSSLYRDMFFIVQDNSMELNNNFKFGVRNTSEDIFLSNSYNYDITYNNADNSITYKYEEYDVILETNNLVGFKVIYAENGEPQCIYRMNNDGTFTTSPIVNFVIETNSDYTIYNLMAVATGYAYRTFKVDNNGNILQIKSYAYSGTTLVNEYVYTYTYDEYGFVIKYEANTSSDAPVYEFKNCTYDNNGNRTGFDYYTNGNFQYSVEATFNTNNQITQILYDYKNEYYQYDNIVLDYTYENNKLSYIRYTFDYTANQDNTINNYECLYTNNSFTIIDCSDSSNYFTLTWENKNSINN